MQSGAPCAAQIALKGALVMPAMGARPTGGQSLAFRPSCSGANSPGLLAAIMYQSATQQRMRQIHRMHAADGDSRHQALVNAGAAGTWQAAHRHSMG